MRKTDSRRYLHSIWTDSRQFDVASANIWHRAGGQLFFDGFRATLARRLILFSSLGYQFIYIYVPMGYAIKGRKCRVKKIKSLHHRDTWR